MTWRAALLSRAARVPGAGGGPRRPGLGWRAAGGHLSTTAGSLWLRAAAGAQGGGWASGPRGDASAGVPASSPAGQRGAAHLDLLLSACPPSHSRLLRCRVGPGDPGPQHTWRPTGSLGAIQPHAAWSPRGAGWARPVPGAVLHVLTGPPGGWEGARTPSEAPGHQPLTDPRGSPLARCALSPYSRRQALPEWGPAPTASPPTGLVPGVFEFGNARGVCAVGSGPPRPGPTAAGSLGGGHPCRLSPLQPRAPGTLTAAPGP